MLIMLAGIVSTYFQFASHSMCMKNRITSIALAHETAITVGATSKAVDRLESAGRVRRTANPRDRRSSLVELTLEGERVLAAAAPTIEAELNTWIGSVLPAENLEQLGAMLSMLRQRAEIDPRTDRAEPRPRPQA